MRGMCGSKIGEMGERAKGRAGSQYLREYITGMQRDDVLFYPVCLHSS